MNDLTQECCLIKFTGKRGISWHGCTIIYYVWNEEKQCAERKLVYIDQILDQTNKQDSFATAALIESIIAAIKVNLPFLNEAQICCDNAPNYSSNLLVILISIINAKNHHTFFISRLFHTGVQDGKGITDSHFAIATRHLSKYMKSYYPNKVIRIKTPNGLAYALSWNGGANNSMVQLIDIDDNVGKHFSTLLQKPSEKLSSVFKKRASDILFSKPSEIDAHKVQSIDWQDVASVTTNLDTFSLTIRVSAHSGYGRSAEFNLTLGTKSNGPRVTLDRDSKCVIDRILGGSSGIDVHDSDDEAFDGDSSISDEDSIVSGAGSCGYDSSDGDFSIVTLDSHGMSTGSDSDDIDDLSVDSYLDEILQSNKTSDPSNDVVLQVPSIQKAYCVPSEHEYKKSNFITQTTVLKAKGLNEYNEPKRRSKKLPKDSPPMLVTTQNSKPKTVFAEAIRYANEAIKHDFEFHVHNNIDTFEKIYSAAKEYTFTTDQIVYPGWAEVNTKDDDIFGARYIEPYRDYIEKKVEDAQELFPDRKWSAARLLEGLQERHPLKLDLPSEYEIQQCVNSYLQSRKNRNKTSNSTRRRNTIEPLPSEMEIWVKEYLYGKHHLKPEPIYQAFIQKFPSMKPSDNDARKDKNYIKKQIKKVKTSIINNAFMSIM